MKHYNITVSNTEFPPTATHEEVMQMVLPESWVVTCECCSTAGELLGAWSRSWRLQQPQLHAVPTRQPAWLRWLGE